MAELKFDIAITAKDDISMPAAMGSDDTISIMASDNCGASWYPVKQYTVDDLISSTLTTKTMSLYQWTKKMIIAFKASDGTIADPQDYDVHIDNIVLKSTFADLGVVSLVSPALGCRSNSERVSIAIKNFGSGSVVLDPIFPVITVQVTGPVNTTITRRLDHWVFDPGQVINIEMYEPLDMSLPGEYKFDISLYSPSDPDNTNNILQEVTRTVWSTGSLPLQIDFADYDGMNLAAAFPGWSEGAGSDIPSGGESSWTSCSNLNSPGNVSAQVRLSGNTLNEWMISPYIVPAKAIELKLKLALTEHGSLTNSAIMGSDDKVSIMISSDCGASWTSIRDFTATDALTPALTQFTISSSSYSSKNILIALRATDGLVDDPNDYDFHIDDLQLQSVDFPLPVELLSFSGQRKGNANLLNWSTASEQNVKGFQPERSGDAVHYYPIGFVSSKSLDGNSIVQLDYEFADNNMHGDKHYYRLRQFDIDGRSQLSNVIVIRDATPNALTIEGLYPNPVTRKLLIEVQTPYRDIIKIVAVNNTGQIVKEKKAVTEKGVNTIDLNVDDLIPGMYILKMNSKTTGETKACKFVKQ